MISKAMILGAAAAVIATGTGFYVATTGSSSSCNNGCPIRAMFESKASPVINESATEESGGSCCSASKASKMIAAPKPSPVDSQTLAACVGASAYAMHPQPAICCIDE